MPYIYISCTADSADNLSEAIQELRHKFAQECALHNAAPEDAFCMRFFCSDVHRQAPQIRKQWPPHAHCLSLYIGQAPLDSRYLSLQACLIPQCPRESTEEGFVCLRHGYYTTYLGESMPVTPRDSEYQTDEIIGHAQKFLDAHGLSFEQDVIRTWYYVRDIDNNYAGMIRSRVRHYEAARLTPSTHFIASTGIEACAEEPHVLSWLITEAQKGLDEKQILYLKALSHLSPTHIYGVNFERATAIQYGDCRHIRLSGTASIDAEGAVVHIGDTLAQAHRTIENITALLAEGGMPLSALQSAIVYLRDAHDYPLVSDYLQQVLPPHCTVNIVHGSVCRPDWLIEIEGEALAPITDTRWEALGNRQK